jgi:hypothetical protein
MDEFQRGDDKLLVVQWKESNQLHLRLSALVKNVRKWSKSENHYVTVTSRSHGSSGSIVTDYGLDDRVIEVRSPTGAENFSSSPCIQTVSEAHPASYPMGTGDKARPGRDNDHSPPSSGRG